MNIYLCGLGNPGQDYQFTRHNIGFLVLDRFAAKMGATFSTKPALSSEVAKKSNLVLMKPTTYMNKSGEAVSKVTSYFGADDIANQLFIIHDDLDIEFGKFKLSRSGPKAHNGLTSIDDYLKTSDYWHVRVGVDDRMGDRSIPGKDYVLQKLSPDKIVEIDTLSMDIYLEIQKKMEEIASWKPTTIT